MGIGCFTFEGLGPRKGTVGTIATKKQSGITDNSEK